MILIEFELLTNKMDFSKIYNLNEVKIIYFTFIYFVKYIMQRTRF